MRMTTEQMEIYVNASINGWTRALSHPIAVMAQAVYDAVDDGEDTQPVIDAFIAFFREGQMGMYDELGMWIEYEEPLDQAGLVEMIKDYYEEKGDVDVDKLLRLFGV